MRNWLCLLCGRVFLSSTLKHINRYNHFFFFSSEHSFCCYWRNLINSEKIYIFKCAFQLKTWVHPCSCVWECSFYHLDRSISPSFIFLSPSCKAAIKFSAVSELESSKNSPRIIILVHTVLNYSLEEDWKIGFWDWTLTDSPVVTFLWRLIFSSVWRKEWLIRYIWLSVRGWELLKWLYYIIIAVMYCFSLSYTHTHKHNLQNNFIK